MRVDRSPVSASAAHATPGLIRAACVTGPDAADANRAELYQAYYDGDRGVLQRDYATVVNAYYDLVTDFYEYGWDQSFHFAPRTRGETFRESMLRHEQWLALRLQLLENNHVLDVGCGVGGPMRTIARFAGCKIVGLNNNGYQVERATSHNARAGLETRCEAVKGDFMAMPFADASFDAAYAIEATVHAPRLAGVYAEIGRVLKPGALFAGYEWALTPKFNPADQGHLHIRRSLEATNALVHLSTTAEIVAAVAESGLELIEAVDRCAGSEIPWWERLAPTRNPFALRRTSGVGKQFTNVTVRLLEALHIAPRGSTQVARMLDLGGQVLVQAGMQGIFTPGFLIVARKQHG